VSAPGFLNGLVALANATTNGCDGEHSAMRQVKGRHQGLDYSSSLQLGRLRIILSASLRCCIASAYLPALKLFKPASYSC
jgi:hypothetical protein